MPIPDAINTYRALHEAIRTGHVASCHDLSEGGLAVAIAEMAIGGGRGVRLMLAAVPVAAELDDGVIAFSESLGRLLVEVPPQAADAFLAAMGDQPIARIGDVTGNATIELVGSNGETFIRTNLTNAGESWRGHVEAAG